MPVSCNFSMSPSFESYFRSRLPNCLSVPCILAKIACRSFTSLGQHSLGSATSRPVPLLIISQILILLAGWQLCRQIDRDIDFSLGETSWSPFIWRFIGC